MEDMEDLPQDNNSLTRQSTTCTDEIHDTDTDSQTIFNLRREPHRNQLPSKPPQPNSPTTSNNSSLLMITVLLLGVTTAVFLAMWVTTDKEYSKDMVKKQGIIDLLNYELKQRMKETMKASQCEEELKNLIQKHEDLRVRYAWMEAKLDASIKEINGTKEALAKIKERDWQVMKKLDEIHAQNKMKAEQIPQRADKRHKTLSTNQTEDEIIN